MFESQSSRRINCGRPHTGVGVGVVLTWRGPRRRTSTMRSSSLRLARRAGEKTTISQPNDRARHAQKMAMLPEEGHAISDLHTKSGVRITTQVCKGELLRAKCSPGTGQIYKFIPLFETKSNGYVGRNETTLWRRIQGHKTPNSECKGLINAIKNMAWTSLPLLCLRTIFLFPSSQRPSYDLWRSTTRTTTDTTARLEARHLPCLCRKLWQSQRRQRIPRHHGPRQWRQEDATGTIRWLTPTTLIRYVQVCGSQQQCVQQHSTS